MSELNGDKARFQRLRKAGLQRRDRARAAYAVMKRQAAASHAARNSAAAGAVLREPLLAHPPEVGVVRAVPPSRNEPEDAQRTERQADRHQPHTNTSPG